MIDAIRTHAHARPQTLAIVDLASGRRWSYRALDAEVDRTAAWLVHELGAASGARVATLARNRSEMLVLALACVRAGAVFAPMNWRLAVGEVADLVGVAEPAIVFHDAGFVPPLGVRSLPIERLAEIAADAPAAPPARARRGFDDPSTLLFTSGTSGRPKGVIVTEANAFWGATNFIHGNGVSSASVFLCDMPLFHTAGLFAAARTPLMAAATVLVAQGFDAPVTLARLSDPTLGITHYFSVPAIARMLWEAPGFTPAMLSGLQVYAMGGAPNPPAQVARFVRAGVPVSDGFGMSETSSNFGMPVADPALLLAKAGSCGLPYLSVRARIVGPGGEDMVDGEAGELWLAGPSVTPGYWNESEQTARAFHGEWFRTGDIARRDGDGFYWIVDRMKDMFISGGENVYPAEVEAVLAEMAEIAEAAVIGVPDARWGEVGHAHVVCAPGCAFNSAAILAHCRARLAGYKVPARLIAVAAVPRTASGKMQKHLLRLTL